MRRVERDNVKHGFFLEHKLCTAARSPQEKVGDGPLSNSFLEGRAAIHRQTRAMTRVKEL